MVDLNKYYDRDGFVTETDARTRLVRRTYLNLTGAVLAFAAIEALIFALVGVGPIVATIAANPKLVGFGLLALCLGGPWIANMWLARNPSRSNQYVLLGFYVLMYVALFLPILSFAMIMMGSAILIWQATGVTAALFVALSAAVFMTRADFSFLGSGLRFLTIGALVLIVVSFLFGFDLGIWFSGGIVALMCGYILFETSVMMQHADEDSDVLMAIQLFASVMTLFMYVLDILMRLNRR